MRVLERLFNSDASIFDHIPILTEGLPGYAVNDQDATQQSGAMLSQISHEMAKSMERYDAVVKMILNCSELIDNVLINKKIFEAIDNQELNPDIQPHEIEISEDSYHDILSSLFFAAGEEDWRDLSFTDADGFVYSLGFVGETGYGKPLTGVAFNRTNGRGINFLSNRNGKYYMSTVIFPINYKVEEDDDSGLAAIVPTAGLVAVSLTHDVSDLRNQSLESRVAVILKHYSLESTGTLFDDIELIATTLDLSITNISSGLTSIYTDVGTTGSDVEANTSIKSTNHAFSLWGWIQSLSVSTSINEAISNLCSAVGSFNISERIRSLSDASKLVTSKCSAAATYVYNHASTAYAESGLQGLMTYIGGYFKRQQSIINKDGTISFTDNSAYVPREFIVGLISTTIISSLELVSYVATIANKAIGVVMTVITTIGQAVYSMIQSIKESAGLSFNFPECESGNNNSHLILNAGPIAMYRGEITVGPFVDATKWLYNLFATDPSVKYFGVPGGIIIAGPGSFYDNHVSSIRWEFHPSDFPLKSNFDFFEGLSDLSKSMINGLTGYDVDLLNDRLEVMTILRCLVPSSTSIKDWNDPASIASLWTDMSKHWRDQVKKTDEAVDSQLVDNQCGYGCALATMMFLLWIHAMVHDQDDSEWPTNAPALVPLSEGSSTSEYYCSDLFITIMGAAKLGERLPLSSETWFDWKKLVECYVSAQDIGYPLAPMNLFGVDLYGKPFVYVAQAFGPKVAEASLLFHNRRLTSYTGTEGLFYVSTLNRDFKFSYNIPLYNGKTKWKWFLTTCAIMLATVAVTIVTTVMVKRKIRMARAASVARAAGAQSDYQAAVQGIQYKTDPATGKVEAYEIDTESSEGRAYVSKCYKDYCKVALKNNLLANVIGGSKFDVASFWGEKDVSDDEAGSIISRLTSLTGQDVTESSDLFASDLSGDQGNSLLVRLIAGPIQSS